MCQNQTIADSEAHLAHDLRNEIREQVAQGRSDEQIREYMVARYGDFVLYRPPFKPITVLLWVGPFALLAAGVAAMAVLLRRRRRALAAGGPPGAAPQRRAEIASLLEGEPAPAPAPSPAPAPPAPPPSPRRGRKGRQGR